MANLDFQGLTRFLSQGLLTDYIRLSLDVNWRFTNLKYAFEHIFGNANRSLFGYSDIGGSSVLGDQITDFIREVNYKREGKGSYYFEPTHLQYIPLRKELLDIIQVIYQTRETVFHRDIQTPRRELKIRRAAEYF